MRLFGFRKWEPERGCKYGLGRLDLLHVSQLANVKYYFKISKSANVVCDVFWAYSSCSFLKDKLCCCTFKRRDAVVAGIFANIDRYD